MEMDSFANFPCPHADRGHSARPLVVRLLPPRRRTPPKSVEITAAVGYELAGKAIGHGGIAQLVERFVRNEEARGSNPLTSTILAARRRQTASEPRRGAQGDENFSSTASRPSTPQKSMGRQTAGCRRDNPLIPSGVVPSQPHVDGCHRSGKRCAFCHDSRR